MAAGSVKKYTSKAGKVSWQAVYDLPPGIDGKRRQKRITKPTRKEAEAALAEALAALGRGGYVEPARTTVKAHLLAWLEAMRPTVKPTTYHGYKDHCENHLIPRLGHLRLPHLTPLIIQRLYADLLASGLTPGTVSVIHAVLRRSLFQAVKWRLLAVNPCQGVDVPQPGRREMTTWTAQQARAFLTGTAGDDLHALFRLALSTGTRQGELLTLTWEDIDLERATLAIRRTLTRDADGKPAVGEPKSGASRRSVALSPADVAALRRHKAQQAERRLRWGETWQDGGLVFDRGDGRALNPDVARDAFHRLGDGLKLPRIRFHDLRHTAATLMLAQGTHPKIVQERLGHSTVSMTLDRYSHVSMDMQREAADRLDAALGA